MYGVNAINPFKFILIYFYYNIFKAIFGMYIPAELYPAIIKSFPIQNIF